MKISVPDYPTLSDLKALQAELVAVQGKPVTLDLSAVERLSTQLLQLLLSAAGTWRNAKLAFSVEGITDSCKRTLSMAGINESDLQTGVH